MTLTEFLLARIAEDERRVYRADSDGAYRVAWVTFRHSDGSMGYTTVASDHHNEVWCANGEACDEAAGDRYAVSVGEPIFDARRALAECEAKRRIIELHHNGDEHECWEMHRGVVPADWEPRVGRSASRGPVGAPEPRGIGSSPRPVRDAATARAPLRRSPRLPAGLVPHSCPFWRFRGEWARCPYCRCSLMWAILGSNQ